MKFLLRWVLDLLWKLVRQKPKMLCDGSQASIFTCNACKAYLSTICRFKDQSFCESCRDEIDSDISGSDSD